MTKVLFIEDEPMGVDNYFRSLKKRGFECELARDGDEALAKLNEQSYDILSLDVMFEPGRKFAQEIEPRRAGLRLLELIRDHQIPNCNPNLKVIVLTAVFNPPVEEKIKNLGVCAYLKKPVPLDDVVRTFLDANSKEIKNQPL